MRVNDTIGRIIRLTVIPLLAAPLAFNLLYLPRRATRECGGDSFRATAAQINRIVGRAEPLYSYKLGAEPAALLFYLDRDAPPLAGRLGDAPPGYVIAPINVWRAERDTALDLRPVFESTSGAQRLVLLRHGPALARTTPVTPLASFYRSRAIPIVILSAAKNPGNHGVCPGSNCAGDRDSSLRRLRLE